MLYHVVAMAENRVIGKDHKLPWHFSADLKHFKQLTTGQTVIMGRKTFESIGRPLPNRENFVLSRRKHVNGEHLQFFDTLEKAFLAVTTQHAYIIGGADLFRQTIDGVNGIYLTEIDADYEGDVFYPPVPSYFKEKTRHTIQGSPRIEVVFYENTAQTIATLRGIGQ